MNMKKTKVLAILILIVLSCVQAQATLVQVSQEKVRINEVFSVDVECDPTEPVKGWEMRIRYDTTRLVLINITEGDFFLGYTTFYRSNDTIAYGLIMGKDGNVTKKGVLATLTFKAVRPGCARIMLSEAGVCNEHAYIQRTVIDGNIRIKQGLLDWMKMLADGGGRRAR